MNTRQAKALGKALRSLREDRRLAVSGCAREVRLNETQWRDIERGMLTVEKTDIPTLAAAVEAEASDIYERAFDLL